jgi:predicted ester cyclase
MKQLVFVFALGAICLASCGTDNSETSTTKTTDSASQESAEARNIRVAKESIAALNNHDVDGMFKNASSDVVDYGDGNMPPMNSVDSTKMIMKEWFTAVPDMKADNSQYFADGNKVVVISEVSGTWKADMMGQKATNKSFKYMDADIFTFNDQGQITEHRSIQDQGPVMSNIGMQMPE